jgi:MoxR-like ATPase
MNTKLNDIKKEIKKVVVGHNQLINSLLIGLISDGHILVEGVPGLAKTTAINAIASSLGLEFKRVQFTPDLLPSDITGTQIYSPKTGDFSIKKGPIFTNLLLADEINRAPAKVQSALLEVMQENQATIGDTTFKIPKPFLVLATQNPIESQGAYSLPEAQLDRFMLKVDVSYNSFDEEIDIVNRVVVSGFEKINKVASQDDLLNMKNNIKKIHKDEALKKLEVKKSELESRYSQFLKELDTQRVEFKSALQEQLPQFRSSVKAKLDQI